MTRKKLAIRNLLPAWVQQYRFLLLLIFLVVFTLITPVVELADYPNWPLSVAFALVVVAAINATVDTRIPTGSAVLIGTIVVGLTTLRAIEEDLAIHIVTDLLSLALLILTIITVLRHIVSRSETNFNILSGAAALYLLLAFAWAILFRAIEEMAPGAFRGLVPDTVSPWNQYLYFSLVTLTTLGYGDIAPVHPFARIFASLEAVTGVLYLAMLVSRLISMYRLPGR